MAFSLRQFVFRFAMATQVFLLRRNWMGAAGDYIMVITTTGRKTGRKYAKPISYLYLGEDIIAFTSGGGSDWYRNIRANGRAELEIRGKKLRVSGRTVEDDNESKILFDAYRREPTLFERLFRATPDAEPEVLDQARRNVRFVRFSPIAPDETVGTTT